MYILYILHKWLEKANTRGTRVRVVLLGTAVCCLVAAAIAGVLSTFATPAVAQRADCRPVNSAPSRALEQAYHPLPVGLQRLPGVAALRVHRW
jgi:predicted PurR-regulated permease PerM